MGEAKRRGTFQQRRWLAQETARRNRVALGLPEDQAEGQARADEYTRRMRDAVAQRAR